MYIVIVYVCFICMCLICLKKILYYYYYYYYAIKNLIEGYMMFNEDISIQQNVRSKKILQHKKYTINRCTFILMLFMINLTIDLYYYYE